MYTFRWGWWDITTKIRGKGQKEMVGMGVGMDAKLADSVVGPPQCRPCNEILVIIIEWIWHETPLKFLQLGDKSRRATILSKSCPLHFSAHQTTVFYFIFIWGKAFSQPSNLLIRPIKRMRMSPPSGRCMTSRPHKAVAPTSDTPQLSSQFFFYVYFLFGRIFKIHLCWNLKNLKCGWILSCLYLRTNLEIMQFLWSE